MISFCKKTATCANANTPDFDLLYGIHFSRLAKFFLKKSKILQIFGIIPESHLYKQNLLTVGGTPKQSCPFKCRYKNHTTEILERNSDGKYIWSTVDPDFKFTNRGIMQGHSLVNIKSSDMTEEFILLSGGYDDDNNKFMELVYKFNGIWHLFGQLRRPRGQHNSIYWNGAVYFIGGVHDYSELDEDFRVRMEIWKIQDFPDRFETTENWPKLFKWEKPHLFIVPDSFFPDH